MGVDRRGIRERVKIDYQRPNKNRLPKLKGGEERRSLF